VERLRTSSCGWRSEPFPEEPARRSRGLRRTTSDEMRSGLDDDLNTARALGAVFDMVRDVNAAADAGDVRKGDVLALLQVLQQFEEILPCSKDDDAAKVRATVEWAKSEGLEDKISAETAELGKDGVAGGCRRGAACGRGTRRHARMRDFARSMRSARSLAENGIILENTKDGVRWKRKVISRSGFRFDFGQSISGNRACAAVVNLGGRHQRHSGDDDDRSANM